MAHKKGVGSTSLGRDSQSKRLGIKLPGGAKAKTGAIIVRQRGTKFHAGTNVKRGGDDTLFAMADGIVSYLTKKVTRFDGALKARTYVNVTPSK